MKKYMQIIFEEALRQVVPRLKGQSSPLLFSLVKIIFKRTYSCYIFQDIQVPPENVFLAYLGGSNSIGVWMSRV